MKTQYIAIAKGIGTVLALSSAGLLLCQTASAAVGFTVTPSAVSNTYDGTITLQVTGLASGDTVVVQKFLDVNTNGAIDPGDLLVQQFSLTDGQAGMVIGGVTNINVPGDTDTTAGQITALLSFVNGDFTQNIIGQYLYKLSSPAGHFTALTKLFNVTNFPYAQKFTGNVVSNGSATTLSNAVIVLFPPPQSGHDLGQAVAGAVANNSGDYTIRAPPGTYSFLAVKSNYVYEFSTTPVLTLGSGATVTANLTLTSATASITGQMVDATNNSIGLPGVIGASQSTNGFIGVFFTDTNGNFTARVTSGQWGIGSSSGVTVHGYAQGNNKPTFSAGATGITVAYTKATALFYGSVQDNLGNPLPGVAIDAYDSNNNQYDSESYSTAKGKYWTAAVGGLGSNDTWQVSVDHASNFPDYNFSQASSQQNGGVNISVGQAVRQDFTAILATNHITGNVNFNSTNLVSLQVNVNTEDTNDYQAQSTTDINGNYSLTVANGTWSVYVNCQGNNNSLQSILGSGNYQCPCGANVTISNNNGTANITVLSGGSGEIFGYLTNTAGNGINGVTVTLLSQCSGPDYSTSTGGNGYYSINVPYGAYNVNVDCGGLSPQGYQCVASANVTLSSASVEQDFTAQSSGGGGSTTLYGYVEDNAGNRIVGVSVNANNGNGINYSTTTDQNGYFGFDAGNGDWDVSVSCAGLNSLGYACDSDESTNIYMDSVELFFTVQPGGSSTPVEITTASVPPGLVGMAYSQQLSASGGQSPYLWSLDPVSLLLPAGVLLSSNGVISGMPTSADLGTNYFIVDVTDHLGNTTSQSLSLIIYPALTMATNALPNGAVGTPYSAQILVSGGNTTYGYSFNLVGTLPPGLNVSTGTTTSSHEPLVISGTPTNSGTFLFTVEVYDGDSDEVQGDFTITIRSSTLQITTASLPNATAEVAYTDQLQASGGAPPYTWTIATGSQQPPSAVTLSTNGRISGVPSASGTNSFIVRLTDNNSTSVTRTFTLITGPNTRPSLGSAVKSSGAQFEFLLNGASGQNYTLQLSTNLSSGNWISLFTTNNPTTGSFPVTDPNATNQQGFYRILVGP